MILLGLNVVNSIDTQDFVLYSSVYFKQNLIVAEKKWYCVESCLGKASIKKNTNWGFWLNLRWHLSTFGTWAPLTGAKGVGHNWKIFFIALFHVLDYLDQFKAIKENLLKGVGHLYPLRTPTYLRLSQKPKFVVFFYWSLPSLCALISQTKLARPK